MKMFRYMKSERRGYRGWLFWFFGRVNLNYMDNYLPLNWWDAYRAWSIGNRGGLQFEIRIHDDGRLFLNRSKRGITTELSALVLSGLSARLAAHRREQDSFRRWRLTEIASWQENMRVLRVSGRPHQFGEDTEEIGKAW